MTSLPKPTKRCSTRDYPKNISPTDLSDLRRAFPFCQRVSGLLAVYSRCSEVRYDQSEQTDIFNAASEALQRYRTRIQSTQDVLTHLACYAAFLDLLVLTDHLLVELDLSKMLWGQDLWLNGRTAEPARASCYRLREDIQSRYDECYSRLADTDPNALAGATKILVSRLPI